MSLRSTAKPADVGKNPQLEETLTARGFDWNYHGELPVELFNQELSLQNQARIGHPLNRDTVQQYVTALQNGDVFPAIIAVGELKIKGLTIVDGNHRYDSVIKAELKTISAYVITNATPQAIVQLTFEANTRHGLPTSVDDRIQHGLYMVDGGMSAEQAARLLAVPVAKLRTALRVAEADSRAVDAGIPRPRWDRLNQGTRLRLNQIPDDDVFAETVKLTLDAGMTADELNAAINGLQQCRTHNARMEFLANLRRGLAERLQRGGTRAPKGSQKKTPRQRLAFFLGSATTLPSGSSVSERMNEQDKLDTLKRIDTVINQLERVKAEIQG